MDLARRRETNRIHSIGNSTDNSNHLLSQSCHCLPRNHHCSHSSRTIAPSCRYRWNRHRLSRHRSNLCRWSLNQNHCLIRSQIPIRSNRIRCRSFRLTACCRNRNRWDQSRWAWIHSSLNRYHWGPMIRILMVCCRFANLTAIRIASLTASRIESVLLTDACLNQAVCGIVPKNPRMLFYMKFLLCDLYSHLVMMSSGSARDNLSQDLVSRKFMICVTLARVTWPRRASSAKSET